MHRLWTFALAVALVSPPASAQQQPPAQQPPVDQAAAACIRPDSVAILGNSRVTEDVIRNQLAFPERGQLAATDVQRAIRSLYALGQFEDVRVDCLTRPGGGAMLAVVVKELPLLRGVTVQGTDVVSERTVRDQIAIAQGGPVNPARVAQAKAAIDSVYESRGYFLSQVDVDSVLTDGSLDLNFLIHEGGRLAISGMDVVGNDKVPTSDIVGAMESRPEGFLWFRKGSFDETEFAVDVGQRIPALYASRGFIDAVVTQDTVVIDREHGKALIRLTVQEGEQYRLGRFDVIGNQRFSTDEVRGFYPFGEDGPTLTQRLTNLVRGRHLEQGVFDESRWAEATESLRTAYSNEGYIFSQINPVLERSVGPDSEPVVNLRWEIAEGNPAIVNRVEIVGNDYTEDACIRRQLVTVPGAVFNRDLLIRSWQSIGNLGFFETPLTPPDVQPSDTEGDVNVVFTVKEKRTGNVNFGASMGQGTGVGGFIGLDQPNLFGQCKRGSIQWQFGKYINDANVSYTDPAIRGSLVSGTVQAYNTRSRYYIGDLGRSTRAGGSLRFGFPFRNSNFTRVFLSYGGESVRFGSGGLLGQVDTTLYRGSSFRSNLGLDVVRDTRIGLPFPVAGSTQSISAQFNGGPLGGNTNFQRYTGELKGYAPIASIGGDKPGSQPMEVVFGLSSRVGFLFGDPRQFFFSQKFTLGGVQYGEQLRGYPEFSITPLGYLADSTDTQQASLNSFGNAFFTTTAELGLRVNSSVYVNAFFDAGNVWHRASDFNPTRLFRGAGIGVSTITPLGPLGLDYAYGFDRTRRDPTTGVVRPAPKWEFHFRLGQMF